jgi:hypothetical protein
MRLSAQSKFFSSSPLAVILLLFAVTEVFADGWFWSAWPAPRHRLWLQAGLYHHRTSTKFASGRDCFQCQPGDRIPYDPFNQGKSIATYSFVQGAYGLTSRLSLMFHLPYASISFNDRLRERKSQNLADVRFGAKWNFWQKGLVASLVVSAKAPTGEFAISSEIVPIGEGQWDASGAIALGKSFFPLPVYAGVSGGYVLRFRHSETEVKPGNEWIFLGEIGGQVSPWLGWRAKADGLIGENWRIEDFLLPATARRIFYLTGAATITPRTGMELEFVYRYPVTGRNYPTGGVLGFTISQLL